jgi:hypothetical protein
VNRKALWSAAALAAICAAAMLTLLTWPAFRGGSWELAHPPAWWQFEWLATIGFVLCALPSFAVFHLHDFFASHESLRYPFAGLVVTLEVMLLCLFTYRIVRSLSVRAASEKPASKNRPD